MSKFAGKFRVFATAKMVAWLAILFVVGPAQGQSALPGVRRTIRSPLAAAGGNGNGTGDGNVTTITGLSATPATVLFNANAPGTAIPGSSTATVSFTINSNTKSGTWTLSAGTTSTTFPGCTTVPVSAVSLRCASAIVSGSNNKGASASCSVPGFTPLPATLPGLAVASGGEPQSQGANFTVALNYQLADSWRYIANTCPLTVIYTVNAP